LARSKQNARALCSLRNTAEASIFGYEQFHATNDEPAYCVAEQKLSIIAGTI